MAGNEFDLTENSNFGVYLYTHNKHITLMFYTERDKAVQPTYRVKLSKKIHNNCGLF